MNLAGIDFHVFAVFDAVDGAVTNPDDAVGDVEHFEVVGGGDDGGPAFLIHLAEEVDDRLAGVEVEVAGGFVGENDGGVVGEGAGDGDALLLAAGELRRLVEEAMAEFDPFEDAGGFLVGVCVRHAGEDHREGDIFKSSHHGDEIERLKNVPDLAGAQPGEFQGVELGDVDFVDEDFAGGRFVEAADRVEEGGLAGAGGAHDGDVLAFVDGEGDAFEDVEDFVAHFVFFGDVDGADDFFARGLKERIGGE